jgi:hypothetical protein
MFALTAALAVAASAGCGSDKGTTPSDASEVA